MVEGTAQRLDELQPSWRAALLELSQRLAAADDHERAASAHKLSRDLDAAAGLVRGQADALEAEKLRRVDVSNTLWTHIGELHADIAEAKAALQAAERERDNWKSYYDDRQEKFARAGREWERTRTDREATVKRWRVRAEAAESALQAATDERDELQADRDRQASWSRQDDWLRDQHARYHDVPGNMFGKDECGELRCSFWDSAVWVLNAPQQNAAEHIPCPPEDNCRVCRGVAALGVGVPEEAAKVMIKVDGLPYEQSVREVTEADILAIPIPPLRDVDVWVKGDPFDRPLRGPDRALLTEGLEFYTAPRFINPGSGVGVPTEKPRQKGWDYTEHPGDCHPQSSDGVWTVCCRECAGTGVFPVPWIRSVAEGREQMESASCVSCKGTGRSVVGLHAAPGPLLPVPENPTTETQQ